MTAVTTGRSKAFLRSIHIFRALAIVLIVGAHVQPVVDWPDSLTKRLVLGFTNESSTYFMFISGFLFHHLSGRFAYGDYLATKFRNVVLPYILLSLPAIVMFVFVTQRPGLWPGFYDMPQWEQVLAFIVTGKHLAPMWFIPMMVLFYLSAPLFVWIDRRHPVLYLAIIPLLVYATTTGRGGHYGPLNMYVYFLPVYLLGMWVSRNFAQVMAWARRWAWPLGVAVLALYIMYVLKVQAGFTLQTVLKPLSIPLILLAFDRWSTRVPPRIDYLADISFGIYFVHAYFIAASKLAISSITTHAPTSANEVLLPGGLPMFLLVMCVVMLFSAVSIRLAQGMFGRRSRMLVGA